MPAVRRALLSVRDKLVARGHEVRLLIRPLVNPHDSL